MPLNAAGAVGACGANMGLDPLWARGSALIGRSAALVAHLIDEKRAPLGQKLCGVVTEGEGANERPRRSRRSVDNAPWLHK